MITAIITDQHLDGRKNSQIFWEYFMKFYNEVFFPTLEKYKVTTILDLGDTFDNRKGVDLCALERIKREYYDKLKSMGIQINMIVGNHTAYYKNTNNINTPDLVLREYDNINIISDINDIVVDGRKITMVPWVNSENKEQLIEHINKTDAEIAMGHLELNGFMATPGHFFEGGMNSDIFKKFKKVFSGHFHHKSKKDNIEYLGNPYQLYWNDYGDTRGFHLFDTDTLQIAFIKNPNEMFKKIYYNDTKFNYRNLDLEPYKKTYVKLIVEQKKRLTDFDLFVNKLYESGCHEVKIVENFNLDSELDQSNFECEDTLTILNAYIEDMNDVHDKSELKSIMKSIYTEACELQ